MRQWQTFLKIERNTEDAEASRAERRLPPPSAAASAAAVVTTIDFVSWHGAVHVQASVARGVSEPGLTGLASLCDVLTTGFDACNATSRKPARKGRPVDRSAFHSATLSTESNAALISMYATCSGWLNSRCSDRRRSARMASIVERPAVNPDCWGRRRTVSSGWSLANRTLAKTLPGTDSSEMGR